MIAMYEILYSTVYHLKIRLKILDLIIFKESNVFKEGRIQTIQLMEANFNTNKKSIEQIAINNNEGLDDLVDEQNRRRKGHRENNNSQENSPMEYPDKHKH